VACGAMWASPPTWSKIWNVPSIKTEIRRGDYQSPGGRRPKLGKSIPRQGLPVPSSVTASPCHLPPQGRYLVRTFSHGISDDCSILPAGRLIIAPTDVGFWKSSRHQFPARPKPSPFGEGGPRSGGRGAAPGRDNTKPMRNRHPATDAHCAPLQVRQFSGRLHPSRPGIDFPSGTMYNKVSHKRKGERICRNPRFYSAFPIL
jgi:hypothetical protein